VRYWLSWPTSASRTLVVSLDRVLKPGQALADNPHHFVVVRGDGDRLSLAVIGSSVHALDAGSPHVDLVDRVN
jgi:hypothetical protein